MFDLQIEKDLPMLKPGLTNPWASGWPYNTAARQCQKKAAQKINGQCCKQHVSHRKGTHTRQRIIMRKAAKVIV